jgi:hypothetical protein
MMASTHDLLTDERIRSALTEFQAMISERFPDTTYDVEIGEDPVGVYLVATVDLDDTDEVTDLVIDRLVSLQVDEELPIHVIPVRTRARLEAMLAEGRRWRAPKNPLPLAVG